MATFLVTSLLAAGLLVNPPADEQYMADDYVPAETQMVQARGGCERAIEQALAITGGELLSVRAARNGRPVCVLTVLVVNAKGRPRKVRMRVPMDF